MIVIMIPRGVHAYQTHVLAPVVTGAPLMKRKFGAIDTAGSLGNITSGANGADAAPPPSIFTLTNAQGQRICRQCGTPGRYKEGKCVEKWGPGSQRPGTVWIAPQYIGLAANFAIAQHAATQQQPPMQSQPRIIHSPPERGIHRTDTLPNTQHSPYAPSEESSLCPSPSRTRRSAAVVLSRRHLRPSRYFHQVQTPRHQRQRELLPPLAAASSRANSRANSWSSACRARPAATPNRPATPADAASIGTLAALVAARKKSLIIVEDLHGNVPASAVRMNVDGESNETGDADREAEGG
ncbi:hypothetical protein PC9H_009147 [Pleurotus ostreatus]|uniref:Uncharacterized protein n=1 Tax=Pleurotus ostreatus TaxID=5322 RepID=A0A8H6ZQC2_PLEOS|nr:uncharacterized protein PC9H_009147 [Pleurotus ostreatus]KAF7426778.1 hypothetical protein PC9H_009147 [Pleurotus ostreatus]